MMIIIVILLLYQTYLHMYKKLHIFNHRSADIFFPGHSHFWILFICFFLVLREIIENYLWHMLFSFLVEFSLDYMFILVHFCL